MAKRDSYIKQMEQQRGEEWVITLTPDQIQRQAKRIVKDMVLGNIDYTAHGKYFYDAKFMENLIIGLSNELEINTLNYNSCRFFYQYYPTTPNLGSHIAHLEALGTIYVTILQKLNAVKDSGNIGYLADTSGILFNLRNHLN